MATAPNLVVAGHPGVARKLRETGRFPAVFEIGSAAELRDLSRNGQAGTSAAFMFAPGFVEDIPGAGVAVLANGLARSGYTVVVHDFFAQRGDEFDPRVTVAARQLKLSELLATFGLTEPEPEEEPGQGTAPEAAPGAWPGSAPGQEQAGGQWPAQGSEPQPDPRPQAAAWPQQHQPPQHQPPQHQPEAQPPPAVHQPPAAQAPQPVAQPSPQPHQYPSAQPQPYPPAQPGQYPHQQPPWAQQQAPQQAPYQAPQQAPDQMPYQAPQQAPDQMPYQAPQQAPDLIPFQTPQQPPQQYAQPYPGVQPGPPQQSGPPPDGANGQGPWQEGAMPPAAAPPPSAPRRGRVIAVASAKGGVGKTSTTVNLSVYAARILQAAGRQGTAVVVDTNFQQADVARYLNLHSPTILDLFRTPGALTPETIRGQLAKVPEVELYALLGPPDAISADPALINSTLYRRVLAVLRQTFDYVFIDTPVAELYHLTFTDLVLPEADAILVPVEPNRVTLEAARSWLKAITMPQHSRGGGVDPEKLSLILNRARADVECGPDDVMDMMPGWRFAGMIPESWEWMQAVNVNQLTAMRAGPDLEATFRGILQIATGDPVFETTQIVQPSARRWKSLLGLNPK